MADDDRRERARDLRRNMTDAERTLWRHLRAKRLENTKFRRQEPIGDYIVDFVSHAVNLVVEVDGGSTLSGRPMMPGAPTGSRTRDSPCCASGTTRS